MNEQILKVNNKEAFILNVLLLKLVSKLEEEALSELETIKGLSKKTQELI